MDPFDVPFQLGDWSSGHGPLYRRLADGIRDAVRQGDLGAGSRLPSERDVARALEISRTTVIAAYRLLRDEGLLESARGSGTRIARSGRWIGPAVPSVFVPASKPLRADPDDVVDISGSVGTGLEGLSDGQLLLTSDDLRGLAKAFRYEPLGLPDLRAEIAARYTTLGLPTTLDEVLITSGAQQAVELLFTLFGRDHGTIVTENPTYAGALDAARAAGATVVGLPVDEHGIRVRDLRQTLDRSPVRLIYLMATCQNPTGVVMTAARRRDVLRLAADARVPCGRRQHRIAPRSRPVWRRGAAGSRFHVRTHIERERKYELPLSAELPSLAGIAEPAGPREETLNAVYFDTADLRLARMGTTLRRRTGGDDAGWHLKVSRDADTRDEIRLPLGTDENTPPAELVTLTRGHTREAPLVPVARIVTRRVRWFLLDNEGTTLVELSDDHVEAEQLIGTRSDSWREIEVELSDDTGAAVLDRADEQLRKTGIQPAEHGSKLARVLPTARQPAGKKAGHVVLAYLRAQTDTLVRHDLLARRDTPDAVHQMRVAARRIRSALRVYRRLFDRTVTDRLRDELRWLGQRLSPARDLEVLEERLRGAIRDLPAELTIGPVSGRLTRYFGPARAKAQRSVSRTLDAKRYLRLLDRLDELVAEPPLKKRAKRKAPKELPKHVRRAYRTVANRVSDESESLHRARKAAKRLRYGAEVAEPAIGKPARRTRKRAKAMTKVLGEHQDSAVTRPVVRELAMQAHLASENAFTFGLLYARETAVASDAEREFAARTWPNLSAKDHREWLL